MNRPSLSVRLAGSPRVAVLLFIGYAAVVAGWWYQDRFPWWLAVAAVGAALRTVRAIRTLRQYKAWLADWQAMGETDEPRPNKKRRTGWALAVVAALLVPGILFFRVWEKQAQWTAVPPTLNDPLNDALVVLWAVAALYLAMFVVWKLLRLLWRSFRRRSARSAERRRVEAEDAPVTWLVGRPISSPSRTEAMRELPEYSARLISGRQEAIHTRD